MMMMMMMTFTTYVSGRQDTPCCWDLVEFYLSYPRMFALEFQVHLAVTTTIWPDSICCGKAVP
jgi:hypothetical protein